MMCVVKIILNINLFVMNGWILDNEQDKADRLKISFLLLQYALIIEIEN